MICHCTSNSSGCVRVRASALLGVWWAGAKNEKLGIGGATVRNIVSSQNDVQNKERSAEITEFCLLTPAQLLSANLFRTS